MVPIYSFSIVCDSGMLRFDFIIVSFIFLKTSTNSFDYVLHLNLDTEHPFSFCFSFAVSDSCHAGQASDTSGPNLCHLTETLMYVVTLGLHQGATNEIITI